MHIILDFATTVLDAYFATLRQVEGALTLVSSILLQVLRQNGHLCTSGAHFAATERARDTRSPALQFEP